MGELMLQDVGPIGRDHFHPSRYFTPCVAELRRLPASSIFFRLFFFFFCFSSLSLLYARLFNPSLATLSRRQPFYNPSLSRLLFTWFFFLSLFSFLNFSRLRFSLQVSLASSDTLRVFFSPSIYNRPVSALLLFLITFPGC